MSRKCRKLQLRALVGRFGSQNAIVGRLDDLGAGDNIDCHVREIAQDAGGDQDAVVRCACQALLVPLAIDL